MKSKIYAQKYFAIFAVFCLAMVFALGDVALAQSSGEGTTTNRRKKTTINFEDELVQGEVKKPELLYLLQQKQFNFKRLIKLREDFLPEMKRTAEDLK